ncbi:hypothetical protein DFH06DRAFT_1143412 [Mycena polygramma]|nr:hypothetical protein DFH06DRAFT_1143412 [Mycena polygramma]
MKPEGNGMVTPVSQGSTPRCSATSPSSRPKETVVPFAIAHQPSVGPVGLIWDSTNYSCAYDALFTSIGHIWTENPVEWTRRLSTSSLLLGLWAVAATERPDHPEFARDTVRNLLHIQNPADFPRGPTAIRLDPLFMAMTDRRSYGSATTGCQHCGFTQEGTIGTFSQMIEIYRHAALRVRFPEDPVLTFPVGDHTETMKLRGLIYHSARDVHFTSIVVDGEGGLWYHDGISTGRNTVNHGNIAALPTLRNLHWYKEQRLCGAIYAKG